MLNASEATIRELIEKARNPVRRLVSGDLAGSAVRSDQLVVGGYEVDACSWMSENYKISISLHTAGTHDGVGMAVRLARRNDGVNQAIHDGFVARQTPEGLGRASKQG